MHHATEAALVRCADALGLDLYLDRNDSNWTRIEVHEKGEDNEPAGIVITDSKTFQVRTVYARIDSGTARTGGIKAGKEVLTMIKEAL